MAENNVSSAVHSGGRIVLWVVLLLLALAMGYAATMVVVNWGAISV